MKPILDRMRPRALCLLLFLLPPSLAAQAVRLLNGDRLEAEVAELRDGILHVLSPWGKSPLRIPAHYIGYTLHNPAAAAGTGQLWLTLRNGDQLRADITGMDAGFLELQSSWGQSLRLQRPALSSMRMAPPLHEILLEHPGDLADWTIPRQPPAAPPPLEYFPEGLALPLHSALTRSLASAVEPFALHFRVSSQEAFHLTVTIETPSGRREGASTMRLMLTGNSLQYQYHHPTDPLGMQRWFAERDALETAGKPFAGEYTLYLHPAKGEALMLWDGALVQRWGLPQAHRLPRNAPVELGFHLQHQSAPVLLGPVLRLPWDGGDPHEPGQTALVPPPRFTLRNRDLLHAELSEWEDGRFVLKRPDAPPLRLSPDQVRGYQPALSAYNPFRSHRRDVRVRLVGGEVLTLALLALGEDRLVGMSDAWAAPLQIPFHHVVSIHWNIHSRLRWDHLPNDSGTLY